MYIKCDYCGQDNIQGEDRCKQCLHSLMQRNLPKPKANDQYQRVMMTAPVGDLLTGKDLLVSNPSDSIQTIVKIFQEQNKNCVLIYKKKKLVGIISFRDILRKVAVSRKDLSALKAEDVMTPNPEYVKADDPIAYAVNKMAMGGFRHLPVLAADGAPLSIIMIKDVLKYLSRRDHSK